MTVLQYRKRKEATHVSQQCAQDRHIEEAATATTSCWKLEMRVLLYTDCIEACGARDGDVLPGIYPNSSQAGMDFVLPRSRLLEKNKRLGRLFV